jgi:hypothetical protein
MGFHVVYGYSGHSPTHSQPFGERTPNQQRTNKARTRCVSNAIKVRTSYPRISQGGIN